MAVAERPQGSGYSLWLSSPLPSTNASWSLLATSLDRRELEQKRSGLRLVTNGRTMAVVEGQAPPYWEPRL